MIEVGRVWFKMLDTGGKDGPMENVPETKGETIYQARPQLLHPMSGAAILGLDWLLFSGNVLSGGLSTPLVMVLGFGIGGAAVSAIQRFRAKDGVGASILKGLGAGCVVGAPLPIGGTVVGGTVLALSGLSRLKLKRLMDKR